MNLPATWQTFAQYLDHLRALGASVNVAPFAGHGALRLATVGAEARPASPDEQSAMERLLAEAMEAGAFGFSTGLVYAPSVYGTTEELIGLARSMAARGGIYCSHIRGEAADPRGRGARGRADRRGRRGARPDLPREVLRPGELGEDGPGARHVRRGARPGRGGHRRCLPVPGRKHQDGQPPARLDARRRDPAPPRAPGRSRRATARHPRVPGRRRAVADRLPEPWAGTRS